MATAAQVIKSSLQRILVQASEAPLEPDEFQDAIFSMNNFMLALDADGVQLGYTVVSDLGDDITIPTGALRGLISNLAIEVSPDYDGQITPGLQIAARDGLATMRKLGVAVGQTRFPDTLPIGAGNSDESFVDAHFYPDLEASILAETTGSISLEVNTNEVAEGVAP